MKFTLSLTAKSVDTSQHTRCHNMQQQQLVSIRRLENNTK